MSAKQNILNKLRNSLTGTTPVPDNFDEVLVTQPWTYTPEQRIPQLRKLMEAVHTEIHLTSGEGWPAALGRGATKPEGSASIAAGVDRTSVGWAAGCGR